MKLLNSLTLAHQINYFILDVHCHQFYPYLSFSCFYFIYFYTIHGCTLQIFS